MQRYFGKKHAGRINPNIYAQKLHAHPSRQNYYTTDRLNSPQFPNFPSFFPLSYGNTTHY